MDIGRIIRRPTTIVVAILISVFCGLFVWVQVSISRFENHPEDLPRLAIEYDDLSAEVDTLEAELELQNAAEAPDTLTLEYIQERLFFAKPELTRIEGELALYSGIVSSYRIADRIRLYFREIILPLVGIVALGILILVLINAYVEGHGRPAESDARPRSYRRSDKGVKLDSTPPAEAVSAVNDVDRFIELSEYGQVFSLMRSRLLGECRRLGNRSNINLAIGISISGLGIYFLVEPVLDSTYYMTEDWRSAIHSIAVRLPLAIVINLFAYFFLNLYRLGLADIRFFQNEITNLEHRLAALIAAKLEKPIDEYGQIVYEISKTERNFVLSRGQSTIDLRREEISASSLQKFSDIAVEAFKAAARAQGSRP